MAIELPDPPAIPTNLFDLLQAISKPAQQKLAHEAAMSDTDRGRRSVELRNQAQSLRHRVPPEQTHALFRKAADLHPPEDKGRAAAAARFDLARSFEYQQVGSELENYLHAEQIYRQVLLCPERDEDPLRAALTRDALAVCLRHIAGFPGQRELRPELLSDAIRYSLEAIRWAFGAGPLGLIPGALYLNNLANHLRHTTRRSTEAMECLQCAHRCLGQAMSIETRLTEALRGPARQMLSMEHVMASGTFLALIRLERENDGLNGLLHNLGGAYLERGGKDDLRQAEKHLLSVIRARSITKTEPARIALAEVYLRQNKQEQAASLLRQASSEYLDRHDTKHLIDLYERAGLPDDALRLAHRGIDALHKARMESLADHIASELSGRAHRLGAMAARIYAKQEKSTPAFLALETTSGAHFEERVGQMVRPRPRHAIARGLLEIGTVFREMSVLADELASRFEHVQAKDLAEARAGLQFMLDRHKRGSPTPEFLYYRNELVERYWRTSFTNMIEKALAAADPVSCLRGEAATHLGRLGQLGKRAGEFDPTTRGLFYFPLLNTDGLAALLKQYPDTGFIRLSMESDLLIVAVWHEKGRIRSASQRLSLPRRLFSLLNDIRDDPKAAGADELRQLLARVDLSSCFPPTKRAVLLPSRLASLLPLAALGPVGKTMLDRYKSILWLPSLAPLRARQNPEPPRQGLLTVAPQCVRPLHLQQWACQARLPGERTLLGLDATLGNVREQARAADVVSFYTHGRHEPMGVEIELADKPLQAMHASCFRGAERIELWACQTGVNLATDWLDQQGQDQEFGLDVAMLEAGARSAIGSLWAVPELVTACIVRRYRLALRAGEDAATALCTAQRAFRDEVLPQILSVFGAGDAALWERVNKYFARLASRNEDAAHNQPEQPLSEEGREQLRASLTSPTAWAGFRFVGVPEYRPTVSWDPELMRPLTDYELMEVEQLAQEILKTSADPSSKQDAADAADAEDDDDETDDDAYWQEQEVLLRDALAAANRATSEHALKIARLYHDRLHSSHQHNLLLGLAWLYAALVDSSPTPEDQATLRLEAAHLWLELAAPEVPSLLSMFASQPVQSVLDRANHLLSESARLDSSSLGTKQVAYRASLAAAQARHRSLSSLRQGDLNLQNADRDTTRRDAVAAARPLLEPLLTGPIEPDYAVRRALSIALGILLESPKEHRKTLAGLVELVRQTLPLKADADMWASCDRLVAWQRLALEELEPEERFRIKPHWALLPRERVRIVQLETHQLNQLGPQAGESNKMVFSKHLSAMEQGYWGAPSARLRPFLQSTGTPGEAYRALLGSLLRTPEDGPAVHHIACMQQACDLRTAILHRLIQLSPLVSQLFQIDLLPIWELVLHRERLMTSWQDAVSGLSASSEFLHTDNPIGAMPTRAPDAFTQQPKEYEQAIAETRDPAAWVFASIAGAGRRLAKAPAQTLAIQAANQVAFCSKKLDELWQEALRRNDDLIQNVPVEHREEARLSALLDPGVEIKACERWIRELPEGHAVLGLMFTSLGTIAGSFVWRTKDGQGEHSATLEPALHVRALLVEMFRELSDATDKRGLAGQRGDLWQRMVEVLAPFLLRLMAAPLQAKASLHLNVLAPGSLRILPLVGLHIGDMPLLSVFRSVTHLPALKFSDPVFPEKLATTTACLFADSEPSEGVLEFGRATIQTLRRVLPATPVETQRDSELRGSDIVENDAIQSLAPDLVYLRVYGQGTVISTTPTDAALLLSHGRALSSRNIMDPLPRCQVVELWAATAGIDSYRYAASDREDRLPGLVPSYLQCGARGVIDLAWPIFDLVKALVCERYGLTRPRLDLPAAEALAQAVSWTQHLLADWAAARAEHIGVRSALLWLDQARRAAVTALGGDPAWVVPYAPLAEHPTILPLSVDALIAEARHPSHLAAFRYWGGVQRGRTKDQTSAPSG